ncbi:hypothetical protein G5V57_04145 [Nordella sp. HKS 07]|uniref:sugar-transfer associated ATP-grasp domain-containing protein n=1 Tax=Nordella sp. HKS 07 TaxID=2712222 RepID=UPI0013E1BC6F|nr:sugar-transfer associated ATP-grasp domain-containing protein [Nordella sp. HKS 07]QIG47009.1 hypothetical protein G5V57_04145 [Nordella sp. HKS 07]
MLSHGPRPPDGSPTDESQRSIGFWKAVFRSDLGEIYLASCNPAVRSSLAFRIVEAVVDRRHGSNYRSRVLHCPPPHLLWITRQRAETSARFIHRAYCRALWRERGYGARLALLAWYLAWPPVFAFTSIWFTILNGRAIARRTGKSIARQVMEQLNVAWRFGCLPPSYYMFELFDEQKLARAGEYLHRFELKGGIYRLMKSQAVPNIANKNEFIKKCRANGLQVPDIHLIQRSGNPFEDSGLPPCDLFIKTLRGNGGTGAEAWLYTPDDHYQSLLDGERVGRSDLLERIKNRDEEVIIQTRLLNHESLRDLSNGALSTVRILTLLDETGTYEATHAGLRMAVGANRLVDNSHAGGIIAAVEMKSGRLGPATDIGLRPEVGWRTHHPDTGAAIEGRVLPFWPETVALACRAHATFAPRVLIGWDIAITSEGPVLIEGNGAPGIDLIQRAYREPAGNSRLGELICVHLRNDPATMALID